MSAEGLREEVGRTSGQEEVVKQVNTHYRGRKTCRSAWKYKNSSSGVVLQVGAVRRAAGGQPEGSGGF